MDEKFMKLFLEAMEMEGKEIKATDRFRDYNDWSSIKELSLIAMMDSEYGIELEMKDFITLITVGDVLEYIKNHSKI